MGSTPGEITQLLDRAGAGSATALHELWERVYDEVREIAGRKAARESAFDDLDATVLANEVYFKLHGKQTKPYENRRHFFGAVSRAIEQILIDDARSRGRLKRGGNARRVPLSLAEGELECAVRRGDDLSWATEVFPLLSELDEDPRLSRGAEVVRLRFVLGLTTAQAAEVLGVSERTVKGDWAFMRAWLSRELAPDDAEGAKPAERPDE